MNVYFQYLLPKSNPKDTRFAINFFTAIGLGGLTVDLRAHLKKKSTVIKKSSSSSSSSSDTSDTSDSSDPSDDSDSDSDDKKKKKRRKQKNLTYPPFPIQSPKNVPSPLTNLKDLKIPNLKDLKIPNLKDLKAGQTLQENEVIEETGVLPAEIEVTQEM